MSRLIINIVDLPIREMNNAMAPALDFQPTPGFEFLDANYKRETTPTTQFAACIQLYQTTDPDAAYQFCARLWWEAWEYGLSNSKVEHERWIGFDLNSDSPELAGQAILSGLEPMLGRPKTVSHS